MYRATNKSLNDIFEKFKVSTLEELTNDQLTKVCNEYGAHVIMTPKMLDGGERKDDYRSLLPTRWDRIDAIIIAKTFDYFMGVMYMEDKHRSRFDERETAKKLSAFGTGQETFKAMADLKFGFYQLKPGMSVDVDWTHDFVEQVWIRSALFGQVELFDLDKGTLVGRKIEGNVFEVVDGDSIEVPEVEVKVDSLTSLPYNTLQKMAKARGINGKSLPKEELIEKISQVSQVGI